MSIKKLSLGIAALVLLAVSLNSCKKDPLNPTAGLQTKCENALESINTAAEAYYAAPSTATCEGLRDAYSSYINSCAAAVGYNKYYEEVLADWDCSGFDE